MKKASWIIVVVLFVGFVVWLIMAPAKVKSSVYDSFAQCIKASGATFYGAFWCPHCQAQKAEFGTAVQYLPYVECSTPDGNGQTQICIDQKILSYPTWILKDGTRLQDDSPQGAGVKLETLASSTGCTLPQ